MVSYPGVTINWDRPEKGLVSFRLSNDARNDLATFCRIQTPVLFTNLTQPSRDAIIIAFRSDSAQLNPRLEMLTHFHPLIQWIIQHHRQNPNAFFPTAAIELETSLARSGLYLIVVEFREFYGLRKELQMAAAISPLGQAGPRAEVSAEELIQEILNKGRTWEFAHQVVDAEEVANAWENCIEQLGQEGDDSFQTFEQRTLAIAQQRRSHLESYRDRKEEEWRQRIETLKARTGTDGQIKGFEGALHRHLENCRAQLERIEKESRTRSEFRVIVALICKVTEP